VHYIEWELSVGLKAAARFAGGIFLMVMRGAQK
jgi:hypothetical protein